MNLSILTNAFDVIVKLGSIGVLLVYSVFAVMIVRQIKLMVQSISTPYEGVLTSAGWIHLGVSIVLLLVAIVL